MFSRNRLKSITLGTLAAVCSIAPASAAPKIKPQKLSTAETASAFQACKTLSQCVDILERHDVESFDYAVLAGDFERFGDKGREVLWRLIDDGVNSDEAAARLANRALDILSRSPKILPPAEQRRMVDMWTGQADAPYKPRFLMRLMMTNLSPMVRSTAVNTLEHKNSTIAEYSREILAETVRRQMTFPMPAADFTPLTRAALKNPSPTLVALTALYPSEKAAPVLARILKSSDTASVIEAYSALYAVDAEAAFKALVATLYELKPNEAASAVAIGGLLAHRHPLREDGFYMNFAKELTQDSEMSAAGRVAGFDALLRARGVKAVSALSDTPLNRATFTSALSAFADKEIATPYFDVPQIMGGDNADIWLAPLNKAATTPRGRLQLTEIAGNYDTALSKTIADQSFAAVNDYRLNIAGILAKVAQSGPNNSALNNQLSAILKNHPISSVRAAAKIGLEALTNNNPREAVFRSQANLLELSKTIEPPSAFCTIASKNLRDMARAMPYYDPADLTAGYQADRAWLTSGARAKGGWLAGYSRPQSGGLVRYENVSGQGRELFKASPFGPQAVIAVLPTQEVPLGQTATRFWVFATSLQSGESAIYRAAQTAAGDFSLARHAILPAQPSAIKLGKNSEVTFAMGEVNPPLTLSSQGLLRRHCGALPRLEKTPS